MDNKTIVRAKLEENGVHLSEDEIEQLSAAYPTLLKWATILEGMVDQDTEPAITFEQWKGF